MHHRRNGNKRNGQQSNNMYGGGYNPDRLEAGGMNAGETNANILEQQNNERINELSDQVKLLKNLSLDIGNEVREQNSLLDNMGDGFSSTRDLLEGSLRRIGTMLESGGAKHMCYMVGFVVVVMLFLYWLMTHKGTSGA